MDIQRLWKIHRYGKYTDFLSCLPFSLGPNDPPPLFYGYFHVVFLSHSFIHIRLPHATWKCLYGILLWYWWYWIVFSLWSDLNLFIRLVLINYLTPTQQFYFLFCHVVIEHLLGSVVNKWNSWGSLHPAPHVRMLRQRENTSTHTQASVQYHILRFQALLGHSAMALGLSTPILNIYIESVSVTDWPYSPLCFSRAGQNQVVKVTPMHVTFWPEGTWDRVRTLAY